jgi:hypothetical protein
MKKSVIILTLLFVVFAAGTANALVKEYYEGARYIGESAAMLLLGSCLIGLAEIGRRNMMK